MNADAEDDAPVLRDSGVAVHHRVLHFDGATHGVDDAAELYDVAVAGCFDDAPVMHCDGGVDQIAAQRPEPRQDSIFVRASQTAVSDHVGAKYGRKFPGFGHGVPPATMEISTRTRQTLSQLDMVRFGR